MRSSGARHRACTGSGSPRRRARRPPGAWPSTARSRPAPALAVGALPAATTSSVATSPPLPGVLAAAAAARVRGESRSCSTCATSGRPPQRRSASCPNPRLVRCSTRRSAGSTARRPRSRATTRPFCAHVDRVAGRPVSVHLPNGALDELRRRCRRERPRRDGPFIVGYAGNLGIAQGLRRSSSTPRRRLAASRCRFGCVGDGPLAETGCASRSRERSSTVPWSPALVPVARVGALPRRAATRCSSRSRAHPRSRTSSPPSSTTRWRSAGR